MLAYSLADVSRTSNLHQSSSELLNTAATVQLTKSGPDNNGMVRQVAVCKEQVEWAITEKRTFLRQRIQLRLASLYLDTAEYQEALKIVGM